MVDSGKLLTAREKINARISESEDFCFSIISCKSREEVKTFLANNEIDASDEDIDALAKNIEEVSDICSKLSDDEMDKVVGGGIGDFLGSKENWETGGKVIGGAGAAMVFVVMVSGIKKFGQKKGWWGSNSSK